MANVDVIERVQDVAQIARRCPTNTLIRAYVRAARALCMQSRWYRVNVEGVTVADQQQYQLGSDPLLEICGIRAMQGAGPDGEAFPIRTSDPTTWDPNARPGRPGVYAYVPEGQFALHRVPDGVYNLTVTCQCAPKEAATQIPEDLLVKWGQGIQDGALGYLLSMPSTPWSSPVLGREYMRSLQATINNAKADEQRAYNTGTVMSRIRRLF